jgi:ketosteroid isomerase-like protein
MSRENIEKLRAGFEAFNRGDDEAWIANFHDGVQFSDLHGLPDSRTYHGHEGLREWLANGRSVVEGLRFEPRSFRDTGDTVVVDVAASGTGIGSGVPVEWTAYIVVSFGSGKIATSQAFLSEAEALKAAGLKG